MIHVPKLLLADEPTGNLDSKASKDVMAMLESINKTEGTTMLLVTHDPQAASYCDRVFLSVMESFIRKFTAVKTVRPFFKSSLTLFHY